ncbi:MAG TPA: mechanosensitive ion channel family protein [Candidatus Bacteroides avicola]|uniref:Mechanosensitive ion channel family protein n=1 Tax=Candidatus Bacteroides avicola TaxID=2838468 RepID=A0A9D2HZ01_9BACE|nr:mechanosensitive ion channel domain-containing protein [Mediterranea sp. An20]HJA86698.1 mechanosensitive ion channel family protein [Candidatus Bacteroides avicola]
MGTLGGWMNDLLISWGFSPEYADMLDEFVVAALIILLAIGLNYFFQAIVVGGIKRYTRRFPRRWNTLLVERKVVHHLLHVVPGVIIYLLLPLAFVKGKGMLDFSQRVCAVYIIAAILLTLNALLLVGLDIYNSKEIRKNHPIRGLVQVFQVILFFLGGILIVATLIDKSPVTLFAGLGASAAVLMLVFKDSILGFVSGVQLSANDMLRIGDWVTLPNGTADGIVQEITLNTVKIQNWDNTITTIPPYTMVNSTFQNWRGMQESGGRRVDKRIWLDLDTLRFCTTDELEQIRKDIPLMADYQPDGQPTNSQVYRVYIERYLMSLPVVNQDLDLIIAQKEPTEHGLPIRVYFFSRVKAWKEYERIQSDIFDHLLAMAPRFGLKLYQGI